jgi:hypothetical protein
MSGCARLSWSLPCVGSREDMGVVVDQCRRVDFEGPEQSAVAVDIDAAVSYGELALLPKRIL